MRFHPRRVLTSAVVCTCVLIVLLNIHLNMQSVTEEEIDRFIRAHKQHDAVLQQFVTHLDPSHPRLMINSGKQLNRSYHFNQRIIHMPDSERYEFLRLIASTDAWDDRIERQMKYVPKTYTRKNVTKVAETELDYENAREYVDGESRYLYDPFKDGLKVIYSVSPLGDIPPGRKTFITEECPVDSCFLSERPEHEQESHAHILQSDGYGGSSGFRKRSDQIWILWALESPINTAPYSDLKGLINWTATYRADSTIVTPYEKFVPYNLQVPFTYRNYAAGKTSMVAWFVSNCGARNKRMEYAQELSRRVPVDIYGACGSGQKICTRDETDRCNELLDKQYKFYLSFENSNCEYYITEKLFWNGLKNNIVPIVMGGRKEDYKRMAPPHSYIHVEDYNSVAELANYLKRLDQDDTLYNEYFKWKGTGEFINTKFWCRVCAMLHDDTMTSVWYDDVEQWWRQNGTCTEDRWDNPNHLITDFEKAAWTFE